MSLPERSTTPFEESVLAPAFLANREFDRITHTQAGLEYLQALRNLGLKSLDTIVVGNELRNRLRQGQTNLERYKQATSTILGQTVERVPFFQGPVFPRSNVCTRGDLRRFGEWRGYHPPHITTAFNVLHKVCAQAVEVPDLAQYRPVAFDAGELVAVNLKAGDWLNNDHWGIDIYSLYGAMRRWIKYTPRDIKGFSRGGVILAADYLGWALPDFMPLTVKFRQEQHPAQ